MKNKKFPKQIFRKKQYRFIAAALCLALGAGAFAASVHAKNILAKKEATDKIQSATVTRGNISNSIDAGGSLEAAETIDIMVPAGIKVEKIKVDSGEEVTKGQTLATLNKTSVTRLLVTIRDRLDSLDDELDNSGLSSLEKEKLKGEKNELEKTEKSLVTLYKNPKIKASSDGIVSTIHVSPNAETSNTAYSANTGSSNEAEQSTSQMSLENAGTENPKFLFLTADTDISKAGSEAPEKNSAEDNDGNTESAETPKSTESDSSEDAQLKIINDYSTLSIQTPIAGQTPQKSIPETSMYTGTISWDCTGSTFQSGTIYTATIVLTAKSGCTFSEKNLPIIKDASFNWNIYHSGEGNTLKIVAKYEKTAEAQTNPENTAQSSGNGQEDDISGKTPASKTGGSAASNIADGKSRSSSGSMTGNSTTGGASSSTSDSSSEYSAYETVAFTLAKQNNAKISVDVDELDILSVEENQTASVTLDALENEIFTGTVTKISNTASAGNGSAKYAVEITVPMDEKMRIGMSASASIQVSSAEDTLVLPMTALQQKGDETFVYTAKDKDGSLSEAVTVQTGLSDGQNVEISSGLYEGTEVYYTKTSSGGRDSFDNANGFPDIMNGSGMPDARPDSSKKRRDTYDSFPDNGHSGN